MKIKLRLLIGMLAMVCVSAHGSGFTGKINRILAGPAYGKVIIVDVVGTPTGRGSCHTNAGYDFAFDGSTSEGKMYLSLILAAYSAKLNVNMAGGNECTAFSGIENLFHVMLENN